MFWTHPFQLRSSKLSFNVFAEIRLKRRVSTLNDSLYDEGIMVQEEKGMV